MWNKLQKVEARGEIQDKSVNQNSTITTVKESSQDSLFKASWTSPFWSISPTSIIEFKREFIKLSEEYVNSFMSELNWLKQWYEKCRMEGDEFLDSRMDNSISNEEFAYYSYFLWFTNNLYIERFATAILESRQYLEILFFHTYFAYKRVNKTKNANQSPENTDGELLESSKYKEVDKIIEKFKLELSYTSLKDNLKSRIDKDLKDRVLFWIKMLNADVFVNWLKTILEIYYYTWDESFFKLYNDIKGVFWINKKSLIVFLQENKSVLIWIHTILDKIKQTRQERLKEKIEIEKTRLPFKIIDNKAFSKYLQTLSKDLEYTDFTSLQFRDCPFAFMNSLYSWADDDSLNKLSSLFKRSYSYIQAWILIRRNPDLIYRSNDVMYEITNGKRLYLNDLQKYFRDDAFSQSSWKSMNKLITELSKHNLYHYLYPVFLYSIAKKMRVSKEDFKILCDKWVLLSENVEEFIPSSEFYSDLNMLINKEKNLWLTKFTKESAVFHIKKWWIPALSAIFCSFAFVYFFKFPIYLAIIWSIYAFLYIMSEYLLFNKLKLLRVISWYALIAGFFVMWWFDMNYQEVATKRIAEIKIQMTWSWSQDDAEKGLAWVKDMFTWKEIKADVKWAWNLKPVR